ncbi:50S ribosomal protein L29 [Corynebacterium appendicis]|uniref:50S ribosomal protein L29 n=1 Tax=Corynebacterium appendicis TaxID=163202 RepID=UPI0021B0501D|nr:50S ribosomal protein L29 [Corynebacterium appendicis]MCT1684831.1 50S ribosomal protein L29 [Corynebacterium appendicis]MDK8626353.1 50S ribosomal protein L29 [Corynebacterium appendicis]
MATGTPAHEFRELTDAELNDRLSAAKEELFNLRFQLATGQLTNNRRIPAVKRDIARIYTVLRERELGLSTVPGEGAN